VSLHMASVTGCAAFSSGTLEYSSSLSGKSCLQILRNKGALPAKNAEQYVPTEASSK
jgi:hypothetical protein